MLNLHGVTYTHPNRDLLFSGIDLIINKNDKIALTGNNGTGKSTLLKLLAGSLNPSAGVVRAERKPYYIPQLFGQFNNYTVAQALKIDDKLKALQEILEGKVTDENLTMLDNDWSFEECCKEALAHWQLDGIDINQKISGLSGGQKTKVFLSGIQIHRPEIVLMDEPSNHLDTFSRNMLYNYIHSANSTLVVVSHDRTLLNLLDKVYELDKRGITVYGGNYDFYQQQKKIEAEVLSHDLASKEKALRKARETEKESRERQQKLDTRGKKKQEKAGLPKIVRNALKNKAENSTSRMKTIHVNKVNSKVHDLGQLRKGLSEIDRIKIDLHNSGLHQGRVLLTAKNINFRYSDLFLWDSALSFQIRSGERLVIRGANGSGKPH